MLRYWGLKETGTSYEQIFVSEDNQWQNIRKRSENVDICSSITFDCYYQKLLLINFWGREWPPASVPFLFWDFHFFSNFLR